MPTSKNKRRKDIHIKKRFSILIDYKVETKWGTLTSRILEAKVSFPRLQIADVLVVMLFIPWQVRVSKIGFAAFISCTSAGAVPWPIDGFAKNLYTSFKNAKLR